MDFIIRISSYIAFSGINAILIYLFVRSFLKTNEHENIIRRTIVIAASSTAIFFTTRLFSENIIIIMVASIPIAFLIGTVCFRAKMIWVGMAAIFQCVASMISEITAVFIMSNVQGVNINEAMLASQYDIQIRAVSYLIYMIFIVLVHRSRVTSFKQMATGALIVIFILQTVSMLATLQFSIYIAASIYAPTINEVILLVSIVVINVFIFALVENIMSQNEKSRALLLIESQNEAHQHHIQQLMETHERIRKMSHDFKHQVDVLYMLCAENRIDELRNHLSDLTHQSVQNLIVDTGNVMLDSILSSKRAETDNHGIIFTMQLKIEPNLSYMAADICVLVGNALDNAMEACLRSEETAPFIELDMTATTSEFMFSLKNSIGEKPQPEGSFFKTKKQDAWLHGIGLKSMKHTCEEYGGDMAIEYNNARFMLWVNLPVRKKVKRHSMKKEGVQSDS